MSPPVEPRVRVQVLREEAEMLRTKARWAHEAAGSTSNRKAQRLFAESEAALSREADRLEYRATELQAAERWVQEEDPMRAALHRAWWDGVYAQWQRPPGQRVPEHQSPYWKAP